MLEPTKHALERLLAQQRIVKALCQCGALGTIYADDDRTVMCGKCWLKVYMPEGKEDE